MANKLCLYCSQLGHIASGCPLSCRPYLGTSVCQLGMTPKDNTSINSSEFSLENEVIKPYLHGLCVGKFRTNVAAVAGSCDCVNWGFLSEPVGEFRTNVAAVAGSCDCIQLGIFERTRGRIPH